MTRVVVLAFACALASLAILLRLFHLQVREGGVWAEEAARLARSGTLVPYRRGAIVDARGVVLASDRETYELELCYRDFRRGHPLAHEIRALARLAGEPARAEQGAHQHRGRRPPSPLPHRPHHALASSVYEAPA